MYHDKMLQMPCLGSKGDSWCAKQDGPSSTCTDYHDSAGRICSVSKQRCGPCHAPTACPGPKGDEYCAKNGGGVCLINAPGCPKRCANSDVVCSCEHDGQVGCTGSKGDSYCKAQGYGNQCITEGEKNLCSDSKTGCGPCDNAYPGWPCVYEGYPGV